MRRKESLENICNAFIDQAMEYNDLPGLVIGVRKKGEEVVCTRGVRDITTKDPLQPGDIFHCASVSKLFTSTAIMMLVQLGELQLEDRLCDLLPELSIVDRRCEDVRLWQMLSHTAGFGDVEDYHWEEALTAETALSDYVHSEEVTDLPLLWEPGTGGFRYSNIAYEILGHIVSAKSGLTYEDFIMDHLMLPAGMEDSTMLTFERIGVKAGEPCPLITEEIRARNASDGDGWKPMALPHEKAEDRSIVPVKYYPYTRSHGPSSTLTANAADLLKWAELHMHGFIDEHVTYEYAEVPNNREKMGLGWFMRRQGGHQLYGHEGTDDGFRASLWMCPELEISIAVLSNLSGAPVKKLNKKLFETLISGNY